MVVAARVIGEKRYLSTGPSPIPPIRELWYRRPVVLSNGIPEVCVIRQRQARIGEVQAAERALPENPGAQWESRL